MTGSCCKVSVDVTDPTGGGVLVRLSGPFMAAAACALASDKTSRASASRAPAPSSGIQIQPDNVADLVNELRFAPVFLAVKKGAGAVLW